MGHPDQAEAAYKSVIAAKLETPRVLDAYGRLLERGGRSDEAAKLYRAYQSRAGYGTVAVPGLARVAANQKPDPLVRSPEDGAAEALFGIAGSLDDRQSADASILYLRMALYLRPDLSLGGILLADRFERLRQYDDAIALYRKVPADSPFYRMAMVQAAVDEQRQDRPDAAIADLKTLTAADPKDSDSWTALGDAYRAANRDGEALSAYDRAVETLGTPANGDWPLFYARAMTKEKLHRLDDSEADIAVALKLAPQQPELLNYLGYSWVDRGRNIPQALAMLEKARSLRPNDGYIVDSVGWAYYKLGRYDDAATALEQAVLMVPGDPTINEHFGDALWRAGQKIEARYQWYHALTFSDDKDAKAALQAKIKTGLSDKQAG
jgi:tetratricopeptide (TPR) repeat protein